MSKELVEKLRELQGVIAKGGITRMSDSETIRQAVIALSAAPQPAAQAPDQAPAVKAEPVATFQGRRLTPEGTSEFWGWLRGDPSSDPPVGALLYTAPPPPESPCQFAIDGSGNLYRRYGKPVCASCVPAAKETDKWESARVADFNAGWNACRTAMLAASQPPAPAEEQP